MHKCKSCPSRQELSNEYLLAKIGVDTAENELLEVWGKIIQYYSFVSLGAILRAAPQPAVARVLCLPLPGHALLRRDVHRDTGEVP